MYDNNRLERFLTAQKRDYPTALYEIKSGRKCSHWMWYIFPQIAGLGFSSTAAYYAIEDMEEATAYLRHPVLGANLREISAALLDNPSDDPAYVMGRPDDLKLRSSMTLFHTVDPEEPVFTAVLDKYFGGVPDRRTLAILGPKGDKNDTL